MANVWGKELNKGAQKRSGKQSYKRTLSWQNVIMAKLEEKELQNDDDSVSYSIKRLKQKSKSDVYSDAKTDDQDKQIGHSLKESSTTKTRTFNIFSSENRCTSTDSLLTDSFLANSTSDFTQNPTSNFTSNLTNQISLLTNSLVTNFTPKDSLLINSTDSVITESIATESNSAFSVSTGLNVESVEYFPNDLSISLESGKDPDYQPDDEVDDDKLENHESGTKKERKFFKSNRTRKPFELRQNFFNDDDDSINAKKKDAKSLKSEKSNQNKNNQATRSSTLSSRAKKPQINLRRLNLKKKVFASRGYRRFNMKKYKRTKWKQHKREKNDSCYKCGQTGHWANDCKFDEGIQDNDDVFDSDLKEIGISNAVEDIHSTLSIKPFDEGGLHENIYIALNALGFKSFRTNQEETIKRILMGQSTIFVSSTGSGKSLCYQLPAYLFWKHRKAITLVISPLISLMQDQLETFPKCLKGVTIHTGLSVIQKQSAVDQLLNGTAQILLISPEAIVGGNTLISFNALPPIAFVCIDEAHCLSEWSNNFRPSYLQLYRVLSGKLKIETFLALTATATKATSKAIANILNLDSHKDVVGTTKVPENLVLTVSRDANKDTALISLLKSCRFVNLDSIIIYCTRRDETERLASLIRISMQDLRTIDSKTGKSKLAWDAQAYHAGLPSDQRVSVQKRFIKGSLKVVVATIAFGMGINKSDVRGIIHFNLPKSFENYMQEIGRAGRDGLTAYCHLFLDDDGSDLYELQRHIYANSTDKKCLRKLIEKIFKPCKCKKVVDEVDNISVTNKERVCFGHEVAFPIESTVLELDIKDETILTVLTYLEANYKKVNFQVLPYINSMCTVLCYGDGAKQMEFISKQCYSIGIALALFQKQNQTKEIPGKLKFSIVESSSMLGKEIDRVKQELRNLEWTIENGRKKRTNVRVAFSDLSFHFNASGDLNEDELDHLLNFVHKYTTDQEIFEISKLKNVYNTLKMLSQKNCNKSINMKKCNMLKEYLNHYFNDDIDLRRENVLANIHELQVINDKQRPVHVIDLEQARRDIRDFLSIHSDQNFCNARSIARILQGIPSPRYPAQVWGKVRRFWRSNIKIDFNELMKIATEELIRLKSL